VGKYGSFGRGYGVSLSKYIRKGWQSYRISLSLRLVLDLNFV
jgi:hypothetical protein